MTLSLDISAGTDLDALTEEAQQVMDLKAELDRLTKLYKEREGSFRQRLDEAGLLNESFQGLGYMHASVSRTKKFDETAARAALTPAQQRKAEKKVIDPKLVEALFPEQYGACQKEYGYTIRYSFEQP